MGWFVMTNGSFYVSEGNIRFFTMAQPLCVSPAWFSLPSTISLSLFAKGIWDNRMQRNVIRSFDFNGESMVLVIGTQRRGLSMFCMAKFFSVFTTMTNIDTFHRSVAARAGIAGKSRIIIYSFHHFRRTQWKNSRYNTSIRKINMHNIVIHKV